MTPLRIVVNIEAGRRGMNFAEFARVAGERTGTSQTRQAWKRRIDAPEPTGETVSLVAKVFGMTVQEIKGGMMREYAKAKGEGRDVCPPVVRGVQELTKEDAE